NGALQYETFYATAPDIFGQPLYLPWSDPDPSDEFLYLQQVQAWMLDAMPSWSYLAYDDRGRMRYHDVPPAYLYIDEQADTEPESELWRTIKLADQAMLLTSSFVPNCSEFIVEWAYASERYGQTISTTGFEELVWHGLPSGKSDAIPAVANLANPGNPSNFLNTPVHEPIPVSIVYQKNELNSYFMPFDPRNGQSQEWPAYIRITVRVADPNEPGYEDTIQMVFPLGDQV
ncbi:MAG: hypothetical protein KDA28_12210, partial [Phycisphaerales bacterium]|nr:hypothetical protein [Phycisphaerales bacterium]